MPAKHTAAGGRRGSERADDEEVEYEFMGPYLGPAAILLGLPLVCYGLVAACNDQACFELANPQWPAFPSGTRFFTREATLAVLLWFFGQVVLHMLLPGTYAQGVALSNGKQLRYKLTGFGNFVVTTVATLYFGFCRNSLNLSWIHDNYLPLMSAAIVFSTLLAVLSYLSSFAEGTLLAKGGHTGHTLYDFFIGRPLNPRLGGLDIKHFCELYPGLLGWGLINLGMLHKEWQATGRVSAAMALVTGFQGLYIGDALWHEQAILTTMDITTDGFGFMLAFGDLAWVPFTYSLPARYLAAYPQALSAGAVVGIVFLKALGYLIFRGSNSQKDAFRRDPNGPRSARLATLTTASGRKLIVSGWWGITRHINYFGDWLMGLAWCLPCGFHHVLPYFYVAYFGALLVHRDLRDEAACAKKYGKDWERYCAIVKKRIVPLIY